MKCIHIHPQGHTTCTVRHHTHPPLGLAYLTTMCNEIDAKCVNSPDSASPHELFPSLLSKLVRRLISFVFEDRLLTADDDEVADILIRFNPCSED